MARNTWSTRTAFLFAAIGSAVGLGNLWRFPYLTYEYGGGAFLIPYLLALFIIGIPFMILEFAIGQKMQKGAVNAFKTVHHKLSGIGWAACIGAFVVVTYYAAVMAWAVVFLLNSFKSVVPWGADSEGYFFNSVLQISDGVGSIGGVVWPLLIALAAVWIIIYLIVRNGTDSVGKVVLYSVPLPIILLVILLIRGITLPGAGAGIATYLTPDFSALFDSQIWTAAVTQIFFTLSLAFGTMIAYSSFNKKNDIRADAYVTSVANSAISIFAGFVVFSVLGFMAFNAGVSVDDVATSGPGLAFVVFPQALAQMPMAPLFSILFFVTILSLGIDSAFSLTESLNISLRDIVNVKTSTIAAITSIIAFLLGILFVTNAGLYFLDIIDHFVLTYVLLIVGIFECLAIGWVYGAENMRKYINSTSKKKIGVWWNYAIKYYIPAILTVLLVLQFLTDVSTPYGGYPAWALNIGWLSAIVPLSLIVILSLKSSKKGSKK